MDVDNTLIPVLRQAVDVFKMILFKELKSRLTPHHATAGATGPHITQLTGATLNALFGVVNDVEPHATFVRDHDADIQQALAHLAADHSELRDALTDALRVQFLCDAEEGIDSEHILAQAEAIGLLVPDRETPLPKTFMHLARVLGIAHGILDPTEAATPSSDT
jgi:hypothetical protein